MVLGDPQGPQCQATGADDQDPHDVIGGAILKQFGDVTVSCDDRVLGQQGTCGQHGGDAQRQTVGDGYQVGHLRNDDVLSVAVGYTVVRVQDDSGADLQFVGLDDVGAQFVDDSGDLVAGEQGTISDAVEGRAVAGVLDGHGAGHGRDAGRGWGPVPHAVAGSGADDADAGPLGRHIGDWYFEAEDAVFDGWSGGLYGYLTTQLIHVRPGIKLDAFRFAVVVIL